MRRGGRAILLAVVVGAAALAAGCATVQPWERGRLANPCMVFDSDSQLAAYQDHWMTSREAAAGGFGVQGGGCGCK